MTAYLNTPAIYSQKPSKVDRKKGIIYDIVVTSSGEAKGHNIHLNDKFLDDVVKLASQNKAGIKARFGHPNICATALGTYLGRFKNFRLSTLVHQKNDNLSPSGEMSEGQRGGVFADLHLDSSSKKSPKGNLYEYVLDMAENNPDMFGASIAFKRGKDKIELSEIDGKKIEKTFASIKALYATDLVDSPAATDGLFDAFHQDDFASQVTLFLDEHPQIFELLEKKPEILDEFISNYKHYKSQNNMNLSDEITKLKNWITDNFAQLPKGLPAEHQLLIDAMKSEFETKLTALPNSDTELSELNDKITLLTDENKAALEKNAELLTTQSDLQTQFDDLTSQFNQLKATKTGNPIGADPNVSLNKKKLNDGKEFIASIPTHARKRLFKKNH